MRTATPAKKLRPLKYLAEPLPTSTEGNINCDYLSLLTPFKVESWSPDENMMRKTEYSNNIKHRKVEFAKEFRKYNKPNPPKLKGPNELKLLNTQPKIKKLKERRCSTRGWDNEPTIPAFDYTLLYMKEVKEPIHEMYNYRKTN
ncbi:hypothetical protein AKO1_008083, partial [Acrasis kona]